MTDTGFDDLVQLLRRARSLLGARGPSSTFELFHDSVVVEIDGLRRHANVVELGRCDGGGDREFETVATFVGDEGTDATEKAEVLGQLLARLSELETALAAVNGVTADVEPGLRLVVS